MGCSHSTTKNPNSPKKFGIGTRTRTRSAMFTPIATMSSKHSSAVADSSKITADNSNSCQDQVSSKLADATTPTPDATTPTPVTEPLKVRVISARGLRKADFFDRQEPYCRISIAGKSVPFYETKLGRSERNPVWDETRMVKGYQPTDDLFFSVWDRDTIRDDPLGHATVTADQVRAGFFGELRLEKAGKNIEAYLKVDVPGTSPTPTEYANYMAASIQNATVGTVPTSHESQVQVEDEITERPQHRSIIENISVCYSGCC